MTNINNIDMTTVYVSLFLIVVVMPTLPTLLLQYAMKVGGTDEQKDIFKGAFKYIYASGVMSAIMHLVIGLKALPYGHTFNTDPGVSVIVAIIAPVISVIFIKFMLGVFTSTSLSEVSTRFKDMPGFGYMYFGGVGSLVPICALNIFT